MLVRECYRTPYDMELSETLSWQEDTSYWVNIICIKETENAIILVDKYDHGTIKFGMLSDRIQVHLILIFDDCHKYLELILNQIQ